MLYRDAVPSNFSSRWVGVVPNNFKATHLRISCEYNTGMSLDWDLIEGDSFPTGLAGGFWTHGGGTAYTYSILIPVASWGRYTGGDILTQGTHIRMNGVLTGGYGAIMNGLKLDFIGKWLP